MQFFNTVSTISSAFLSAVNKHLHATLLKIYIIRGDPLSLSPRLKCTTQHLTSTTTPPMSISDVLSQYSTVGGITSGTALIKHTYWYIDINVLMKLHTALCFYSLGLNSISTPFFLQCWSLIANTIPSASKHSVNLGKYSTHLPTLYTHINTYRNKTVGSILLLQITGWLCNLLLLCVGFVLLWGGSPC